MKPNILYILADDLGWGDLSMHGSPIRTPNIDLLAKEGVELTQHYVCPMCTPTRVSLLTGRHPSRFGAHATVPSNSPVLPDGYETLASALRDAGYDTGLFGKWHLGSDPKYNPGKYGFNYSYGSLAGGVDPYNHCYKKGDYSLTWHKNGERIDELGHVSDLIGREACQWIESRKEPWFCYVPFTAVHVPVKPTADSLAEYYYEKYDDDPLKDASFKKYAAYTTHMDSVVGQLLESLERTCQREKTIVMFASDNGAINDCPIHATDKYPGWQEAYPRLGSNAPFRGVKAQMYEGGIRTPMIVNWRSHLEPGTMDHPVQVTDWMPTFCNMTGAAPKEDPRYDGQDIWSLITGEETDPEERQLFWNFKGDYWLGIRKGDWKLSARLESESGKGKSESGNEDGLYMIIGAEDSDRKIELFNIAEDPYEENECAKDRPDLVKELLALIEEERKLDGSSARLEVTSSNVN